MAHKTKTRTKGITTEANGCKLVQKRVLGVNIKQRLGNVSQDKAEQWLAEQVEKIRGRKLFGESAQHTFREAAERYLKENAQNSSIDEDARQILMLDPYIGERALDEVHNGSLQQFQQDRLGAGVKVSTMRKGLEVARKVLKQAAEKYQDQDCKYPWLMRMPKISMPAKKDYNDRPPYPLSWQEQAQLFPLLPATLARMALFMVNTGLRDQEVCLLRWRYEQAIPELGRNVYVIPPNFGGRRKNAGVKNREPRLVVCNKIAESVIEECRRELQALEQELAGQPPSRELLERREYVFTNQRSRHYDRMNNNGFRAARAKLCELLGERAPEGLRTLHIHDLKHTFGGRLRAVGAHLPTLQSLLGHTTGNITLHYSRAQWLELFDAVDRLAAAGPVTVLRAVA